MTASVTAVFVPKVTPSIAPPFTSTDGITVVPVKVTFPFESVIKSVSSVCPIMLPSILIVLSRRIEDPEEGFMLTDPDDVLMVTAASP